MLLYLNYAHYDSMSLFSVGVPVGWGRGCTLLPKDSSVGCRQETYHEEPAEVCYCNTNLCNSKMEETSSKSPETTTKGNKESAKISLYMRGILLIIYDLTVHKIFLYLSFRGWIGMLLLSRKWRRRARHMHCRWVWALSNVPNERSRRRALWRCMCSRSCW